MKRLLTIFTLTVFLAILTGTASAATYSNTDFGTMSSSNGTYVPGSPGYEHLAYPGSNGTVDAVVGVRGPLGTLNSLNMSFQYSNPIGTGYAPFAAFGISENSLWDMSAQEFQVIAMSGAQINDSTLVHVVNANTQTDYITMDNAITLGQLLGKDYNGFVFGNMQVMRAYAYIGDTGSSSSGSVDINSITVNSSVPEPATMLLLGLGLMGLAGIRRKFKG